MRKLCRVVIGHIRDMAVPFASAGVGNGRPMEEKLDGVWIGERRRPTAGRLGSLAVALFGSVALEALSLRSRALACCSRTTSLVICNRQCVRLAPSPARGRLYRPPIHQVCLSSSPAPCSRRRNALSIFGLRDPGVVRRATTCYCWCGSLLKVLLA